MRILLTMLSKALLSRSLSPAERALAQLDNAYLKFMDIAALANGELALLPREFPAESSCTSH